MPPETSRFQTVQLCRGVAALLVLLFHATVISKAYLAYDLMGGIFLFGYSGVDFFFVLSGFIIFLAHRAEMGHPERVRPYLKKRFIRIYPLYWIVALALMPVYFGAPHHAGDYVVLVKSFLLLPQAENPVVTVAWSLTSEVFFYGMFALIIYLSWRYTRALLIVLLLITAFFYLLKLLTAGTHQLPSHGGFVFSPYNLEFAMGCAAAYLVGRYRLRSGRRLTVIGVTMFLLCGLSEGFLHRHFGRHHSILGYGLSSMLVVWGAVLWEQGGRRAIPSLLLLPGDASYSIYLTHYALLDLLVRGSLALNIPGMIGPALVIGMAIALSLGIGVLFYLYIERPLLAQLRRRNKIRVNYPDVRPVAETLQEGL